MDGPSGGGLLRNNSSILSNGSSSVLSADGSAVSVEAQAAATAGNLARRSKTNTFSDRRDNPMYRDIRNGKGNGKGNGKNGKKNRIKNGQSLPNLSRPGSK